MSTGPEHKLYNYEVTPPNGVWNKISAELDETALASRLNAAEVTPPAHIWSQVAAVLDQEMVTENYAKRIYNFETAPPASAWAKIKTSLDAEHEAAIPERRRLSPLLRYAAAAILIGAVGFGAVQFFSGTKNVTDIVKNSNPPEDNSVTRITANTPAEDNDITATADDAANDEALERSKQTYARLDVKRSAQNLQPSFSFIPDDPVDLTKTGNISNPQETYRELSYAATDRPAVTHLEKMESLTRRYVTLMTPDGNIIRMSKKLGDMVCCVAGEEQDDDCKDQLKKWREKLMRSSATSSGSFLDVLNMVNSLQENRQL